MANLSNKNNKHLFLEKPDKSPNSFVANMNSLAKSFRGLTAEEVLSLRDIPATIVSLGEEWKLILKETTLDLLAGATAFNTAIVTKITEAIPTNSEIVLPGIAKYIVGTNMLMLSYNGTVCYLGEQFEEVGEPHTDSNKIRILFDLRIDDILEFRIVALNADVSNSVIVDEDNLESTTLKEWLTDYSTRLPLVENPTATGTNTARSLQDRFSDIVNVKDYGAKGDGVTDDTEAIQAAFNAAHGKTVIFPRGIFVCSSVQINYPCDIIGSGPGVSQIKAKNPDDYLWKIHTPQRVKIAGFSFRPAIADTRQTEGAYIYVSLADDVYKTNGGTLIEECTFVHPRRGIYFRTANRWLVNFCYFVYYGTGIQIESVLAPDAGDSCITNCTFDRGDNEGGVAINQNSSGGLKIIGNKFLHGSYHYLGSFTDTSQNTSILIIDGNSFEWPRTTAIAFTRDPAVSFSKIIISDNQFSISSDVSGGEERAHAIIFIQPEGTGGFYNATISGNNIQLAGKTLGLDLTGATGYNVIGNQFFGNNTGNEIAMAFYKGKGLVVGNDYLNISQIYTGNTSNVTFFATQKETGSFSGVSTEVYGSLKSVPAARITFDKAFPGIPTITTKNFSKGTGGVGAVVTGVTNTGFDIMLYGVTADVILSCDWVAEL